MEKEVIQVGLYGGKGLFGGRETPLEASVVRCDKHPVCSFYQKGQCLSVRSVTRQRCKFGNVETVRGYTSKAKKYGEFKRKWQSHEKYNQLTNPPVKLGLIDQVVVFPYAFIHISKSENGELTLDGPCFGIHPISYIDLADFTIELLYRICTFRPQAIMGGEIKSYQEEEVPLFLSHLSEVLPGLYDAFMNKHEKFSRKINYVGRKAFLTSLQPCTISYYSNRYPELNNDWVWDGEFLTYQNGYVSNFHVANDYDIDQIRLKPSQKTVVKITNNEQVNKNTVFAD